MKLYATVSSERASKGQGGNDFLEIEILGENKQFLGKINLHPFWNTYEIEWTNEDGETRLLQKSLKMAGYDKREPKGNKQKGECVHGHIIKETCTDACRAE